MAVAKAKKVTSENKDRMHFRLAPDIKRESPAPPLSPGQGLTDFALSALNESRRNSGTARPSQVMPWLLWRFKKQVFNNLNLGRYIRQLLLDEFTQTLCVTRNVLNYII